MDTTKTTDSVQRAGLSRRELAKLAAAAGLAIVGLPMGARGAHAAANLTVFEWAGNDDPKLHVEFAEKHGGSPAFAIYSEEEEAFQKLRSGFTVDIAHPCTLSLRRWRDAGLIKPIDVSRIPRWKDIPASMLGFKGMKFEDKFWLVPFDWGNSTIVYREDQLKDPKQSYSLLLDESLKGRVSILDSVDEVFSFASGILGYPDHLDLTDEQIGKCGEVIRKLHGQVRMYWPDSTTLQQAIVSNEVVAAWCWADTYLGLKGQGVPVKFMFPEERLSTWVCGFVLTVGGSGDEQQAYDYLNAALDPRVGKVLIDEWGYGHSNTQSYALSESQFAKELGLTGDISKFMDGTRFQGEIEPAKREQMIALFEQIKSGG